MAFLTWNDKYSVGIRNLDDQHKKLIEILNQLYEAMKAGKGNEILGKVLVDLITYTKTHFAAEENLMQIRNYPHFAAHKAEHDKLTKKAVELEQQFRAGKTALSVEVAQFLKTWLNDHILGMDKKYGPFLQ